MIETPTSPEYIVLYILSAIATIGNIACAVDLFRSGRRSVSSSLAFYLHITQISENLACATFLYVPYKPLCSFMGFVGAYSSVANILVTYFVVWSTNELLFNTNSSLFVMKRWKSWIIWGLPLISLFPFITDSYGPVDDAWCCLKDDIVGFKWAVLILGIWVWVLLLMIIVGAVQAVRLTKDFPAMAQKVRRTTGLYTLANVSCWLARSLTVFPALKGNVDEEENVTYWAIVLVYVTGLLYVAVHVGDRKGLKRFERFIRETTNVAPLSIEAPSEEFDYFEDKDLDAIGEEEEDDGGDFLDDVRCGSSDSFGSDVPYELQEI